MTTLPLTPKAPKAPKAKAAKLSPAAKALHALISKLDLTRAAFENELGYKGGVIYHMTCGRRAITWELIGRIFKRYGSEAAKMIADQMELQKI